MTVTIEGKNTTMGIHEKYEAVDYNLVTIKEIKRRNGYKLTEVRIARGKRDIRITSGSFTTITVQDDETGRYLLKVER